jgi:hypothetical protein
MRGVQRLDRLFFACVLACLPLGLFGQQVVVTLTPIDQAIKVGIPFQAELSVRHPEDMVVVFPDSAADFAPYELVASTPRPTITESGTSVDATLLELLSWEIDSIQKLQFSAGYLDAKGDTILVPSNMVELTFLPIVTAYSDTLKLRVIKNLLPIAEPFNLTAWSIFSLVIIAIGAALFFLLRKPVAKTLRRWAVKRDWQKFRKDYQGVLPLMPQQEHFTTALSIAWKRYLDRRNLHHLRALTTSELEEALKDISILSPDDIQVLVALGRSRDMLLYAGMPESEERLRALHERIGSIMEKEYLRRKEAAEV